MDQTDIFRSIAELVIIFGVFMAWFQRRMDAMTTKLEDQLKSEIKDEQTQRKELEKRLREVEAELNQIKGKNTALTETNSTLSSKLEEAQRARGTVEAENRLLQAGNAELKAAHETLRDELATERAANKLLREQLDAKLKELERAKVETVTGL